MSHIELTPLPLMYKARHLPTGKKQAKEVYLQEEKVYGIPVWDDDDAPVAIRVTPTRPAKGQEQLMTDLAHERGLPVQRWIAWTAQGIQRHLAAQRPLEYRLARGADGVVRLMAPVLSHAHEHDVNMEHLPNLGSELDKLAHGAVFGEELARTWYRHKPVPVLRRGGRGLGDVLAHERGLRMAALDTLAQRVVRINDQIWAPTAPPGWMLYGGTFETQQLPNLFIPTAAGVMSLSSQSMSQGYNRAAQSMFVGMWEAPTLDQALGLFRLQMDKTLSHAQTAEPGEMGLYDQVDVLIPEALNYDGLWHGAFKKLCKQLSWYSEKSTFMLQDSEMESLLAVRRSLKNWPDVRDRELVRQGNIVTRAFHSISANKTTDLLELLETSVEGLQKVRPPAPLEQRLGFQMPGLESLQPEGIGMRLA